MKKYLAVLLLLYLDYVSSDSWTLIRDKRKTANQKDKRIVCYYAHKSAYRTGDLKFTPEDIHPHLCTHILYAYATLEKDVGVVPSDPKFDIQLEGYNKFINLKKTNPDLQLLLSVGGTNEGPATFSKISGDPVQRSLFARNSRIFLEKFKFDGLDIAWQYPTLGEGSSSSDKENYVLFVKEIRNEFKDDFIISMAVPAFEYLIKRGFDLNELSKYIDFMNVLTYNYHEATDAEVNHLAPLYYTSQDTDKTKQLNVDYTIKTYQALGIDLAKLNLGIPLYGISFILEDPNETDIGSRTEDEGEGMEKGTVIFNTFCKLIPEEHWTVRYVNKTAVGPYAYKDKRWVAYDDEEMVKTKARYAAEKKLGGLMYWSIDKDDFKGNCNSRAFPMIKAGREIFFSKINKIKIKTPTSGTTKAPPTRTTTLTTTIGTTSTTQAPVTRGTTPSTTTTEEISVAEHKDRITDPSQSYIIDSTPNKPHSMTPSPNEQQKHSDKPHVNPETTHQPPLVEQPVDIPSHHSDKQDDPNTDKFPPVKGEYHSNRDIIFQNIKFWINNYFYSGKQSNNQ